MSRSSLSDFRVLLQRVINLMDVWWARYKHASPRRMSTLLLFITYRCNLNCAICGVRHQPREPELGLEDYEAILNSAQSLHTSLMLISGGEALAREELVYTIISRGRERGIDAHLCTNGLLVSEEKVKRLQESGLRSVSVSLESADKEIHERIRGQGTFDLAIQAVRFFREYAPAVRVGINCTVTALNFRGLDKLVDLSESLGVHQLKFAPVHTKLLHGEKPAAEFAPLLFAGKEIGELEQEMSRVRARLRRSRILTNHPVYLKRLAASLQGQQKFRCYAGYASCTIDPFGRVSPCPDIQGGLSIRDHSLEDLWRGEAFQKLREEVRLCGHKCWDPLYTELSLIVDPANLWLTAWQQWHNAKFYFGSPENKG